MAQEPMAAGGSGGALAPMGIGDIVKNAFEIYGKHWQKLIVIAGVIIVPVTIIAYFLVDLFLVNNANDVVNQFQNAQTLDDLTAAANAATKISWGGAVAGSLLISALFVVLTVVVQGAIARGSAYALVGDEPSAKEAYSFGLRRVLSFIWIGILVGLVAGFGPFLVAIVLGLLIPSLIGILVILALIAMLFIGTMLAVAIPALVIENRRGTDALARSWELVKGHFWHVLGAFVVGAIIAGIVNGIITAIFGAFGNYTVQGIGAALAYSVTIPFSALILVLIYVDLRGRVENLTKEQLQQQLAANP